MCLHKDRRNKLYKNSKTNNIVAQGLKKEKKRIWALKWLPYLPLWQESLQRDPFKEQDWRQKQSQGRGSA